MNLSVTHIQGGESLGLQLLVCETQILVLYYHLLTVVFFFHKNNCEPSFGPPSTYLLGFFFSLRFSLSTFREKEREGERVGEKHQCVRSHLNWGPGPQPRHVP